MLSSYISNKKLINYPFNVIKVITQLINIDIVGELNMSNNDNSNDLDSLDEKIRRMNKKYN